MAGNREDAAGPAVRLLGECRVEVGGRPVAMAGRQRSLLAVLAMSAGRTVPVDRLAAAVWGTELPANVRRALQTYVTRLRAVLGADSIVRTTAGYALRIEPDGVDALRFDRLLDAVPAADERDRRGLLAEALALWRGHPFEGVPSPVLADWEAPRLLERYLAAAEQRIDLDADAGHLDGLVAELRDLTVRYPLRESLWARLLVVLDRLGRPAEALRHYEEIRVRLATELGVDPDPELQRIYADLLAGRPTDEPATGLAPDVPRQLPPALDGFVGRRAELKELDAHPDAGGLVLVHGPAGVGKTAVTLLWAHQVAARFPDGQLYVDLRGFAPTESALAPADAIRQCLDAFGVSPDRIPAALPAQVGVYRGLLADRRVLIVLDNARDEEQVRPLLPAGPGCVVVVTSRKQLPGLVVADGARPVLVGLFSSGEARHMLARRLGEERTSTDADAVDRIVERCGRLPLALAIAAARAAIHPHFPLAGLAAELHDQRGGLDAFSGADAATDVRAVLSWSYRGLTQEAARLFRLLALHPGARFGVAGAASLADLPLRRVRELLTELTQAHLLAEVDPGRYAFHDLLHAYATELIRNRDPDTERSPALRRILDHYLHSAFAAARLLDPHRAPIDVGPPPAGAVPESFPDAGTALAWLDAERSAIVEAAGRAAAAALDTHAWQLAWTIAQFLHVRGHLADQLTVQRIALEAATRLSNPIEQARAHRTLSMVHSEHGRHDEAHASLQCALDLYASVNDDSGRATVHGMIGTWLAEQGRHEDAIRQAALSREICRAMGDRRGEANALNEIGWYQAGQGNHHDALAQCQHALGILLEIRDDLGAAAAWHSIGFSQKHLGEHRAALVSYGHALALYEQFGNRYEQAKILAHIGETHHAAGATAEARTVWGRAVQILDDLGRPDADEIREIIQV
jgi:DNA-binding SARP family transcriptional activator/Tfp pilus assembly protein PilF